MLFLPIKFTFDDYSTLHIALLIKMVRNFLQNGRNYLMMMAADFSGWWYQSDKVLNRIPQYNLQQWPEKSVCADAMHHIDFNVVSINLLY